MSEKIIVRQNKNYQVGFWTVDPLQPVSGEYQQVQNLNELTPYGMMLVSLAVCTSQILLVYAKNHQIDLEEIELRLSYERDYKGDCDHCEDIRRYDEIIAKEIIFYGNISPEIRQKLLDIAHQCPIYKIYTRGIAINSKWVLPERVDTIRIKI
jgi:uncharacterized OsmC-like protein